MSFFWIGDRQRFLEVLDREEQPTSFVPFSIGDFLRYLDHEGIEFTGRRAIDVEGLLARMARQGLLLDSGSTGSLHGQRYMRGRGVGSLLARGALWMTPLLGPELTIAALAPSVAHLTGTNSAGDVRNGSGFLLDDRHVLTAAHVVTDMELDEVVHFDGGVDAEIVSVRAHPKVDVAIVRVASPDAHLQVRATGIAFRDPQWADRVSLLGYPPVPQSAAAYLTMQTGEVVNPSVMSYFAREHFLFSATARPGNSGGPIVAADGRLLGIVTQEFTDDAEKVEPASHDDSDESGGRGGAEVAVSENRRKYSASPFFAGIPTSAIVDALNDVEDLGTSDFTDIIPVEDWT